MVKSEVSEVVSGSARKVGDIPEPMRGVNLRDRIEEEAVARFMMCDAMFGKGCRITVGGVCSVYGQRSFSL